MAKHNPKRWQHKDAVPEVLSVKFQPGKALKALHFLRKHGAKLGRRVGTIGSIRVHVEAGKSEQLARELVEADLVEYAEPDLNLSPQLIPNDTNYSLQPHLPQIQCPEAWDATRGLSSVSVAVLGCGVDSSHPELAGKLNTGRNILNDSTNTDPTGNHETCCAGAIAALTNNGSGIASIGWNVKVTPVKGTTGAGFPTTNMAEAIDWVRLNTSCRIINISYAGAANNPDTWPSDLITAINDAWAADIVVVAAAGNANTSTMNVPGAMDHVIAVANVDSGDAKSFTSNYGSWVDIAAPGQTILLLDVGGGTITGTGTSFATPMVCGVLALMLSINPSISIADAVAALVASANTDPTTGFPSPAPRRVNALKSVSAAIGTDAIILLPSAYIDCFSQFVLLPNAYIDTSPLFGVSPNAYVDAQLSGAASIGSPRFSSIFGRNAYMRAQFSHANAIEQQLINLRPLAYIDVLANALTPNCYIDALAGMRVEPNCNVQSDALTLRWFVYDNFRKRQYGPNAINLSANAADVRCALITSDAPPNAEVDATWPGFYNEVTGSNYTPGGIAIKSGQSVTLNSSVVKYTTSTLIRWANSPTGFTGARLAVLYDANTNALIAFGDLGTDYATGSLGLQILIDTNGIFRNL